MTIVKRVLLGLMALLLVLLLAVAGSVLWVIKNPKDAWQIAEQNFFPKDLKITWETIDFKGDHISGLNFTLDWKITGLKIAKEKPFLQVPLQVVELRANLFPKDSDKKLVVENLRVIAPELIDIKLDKPEEKTPEQNPFQLAQSIFSKLEKVNVFAMIQSVDLNVSHFRFASGDGKPLNLSMEAQQKTDSKGPQSITFKSDIDLGLAKPMDLKIAAELQIPAMGTKHPFLEGTIKVKGFGVATTQKLSVVTQSERTHVRSEGQVDYTSGKTTSSLQPKLDISLTLDQAVTRLDASFSGLPGPLVKVDHVKFEMKTPLGEDILWSEKPSTFVASAPIALFFIDKDMRKPLEKSCECKIPELLKFELSGRAWLADIFNQPADQKPVIDSQLAIEGVHNKLLSVDVSAKIKIDKKAGQYILTPALDLEAAINNFQGFRRFLDAKNILIPAPLSLLDGTVKISSHDLVKTSEKEYILPVTVVTNLSSQRQVVNVTTGTVVNISADFKEVFIDVVAKIEDLQLELPPLDPMKGIPRITSDQRILLTPKVQKPKTSKFKIYLSVAVETTKPAAVRLLSTYFKPHLPITMSLHHSRDKDKTGFLKTEPFQIEYLRRKVNVEKMRIDLPELETKPIPVDAKFRIQQTNYTVFIDVVGPINKPDISLTSDPYLPESEIINVLLYDRTSDQIAGADAETSGNVQAAMADRAVGLFGLWAFAATPIKSFSYNPVTKVYSATVALSDDVTAGIGTNWEEATRLELRKRVSKRWMLTAAWVPATQEDEQQTKLVLQWEKRF